MGQRQPPTQAPLGQRRIHLAQVDSTNTLVLSREDYLSEHGLVVSAEHQTGGRGRLGRVWASRPGQQLQFSVVVHPRLPLAQAGLLSLGSGLAVARALEAVAGLAPELKWPNDVLLNGPGFSGRKVCGILCEGRTGPDAAQRLVIGIGLNCLGAAEDFPAELRARLTTVEAAAGRAVSPEEMLPAVLSALQDVLATLQQSGSQQIISEWERRARHRERRVRMQTAAGAREGRVLGLTAEGHLEALTDAGERLVQSAGETEWLD